MKPLPKNTLIGVLIVLGIAGVFLVGVFFSGRKNADTKYYDMLLESKDREIRTLQEHRATLQEWNEEKDKEVAEHNRIDSLLKIKSQQVIVRYEKVPVTVNAYSHDELRGAIEDFGQ